MLAKIPTLAADALILDLEDSVPPSEKENARALVREALLAHGGGAVPLFARVNAVASGLTAADLAAVTVSGLSAVVHPKTRAADDIRRLDRMLTDLEAGAGLPAGAVRLVAVVESPRGLLNAAEIAEASPRLVALSFGAEDLCHGHAPDAHAGQRRSLRTPSSTLSLAAHAAGIGAIDTVCVDVKDEEQLQSEARAAKELGFTGKLAIHPRQVLGDHPCVQSGGGGTGAGPASGGGLRCGSRLRIPASCRSTARWWTRRSPSATGGCWWRRTRVDGPGGNLPCPRREPSNAY